ncbi:MAG: M48 family metallopeptidase [Geovibrio sp.]|nr:M48 family metallopeptidase [Geovibrio sp.]
MKSLGAVRFEDGFPVPLFGAEYPLEIIRNPMAGLGRAEVYLAGGSIKAEINPYLFKEEYFFKALDSFYKTRAEMRITPMLEARAAEMGLKFSKVTFRRTKGRWGELFIKRKYINQLRARQAAAEVRGLCVRARAGAPCAPQPRGGVLGAGGEIRARLGGDKEVYERLLAEMNQQSP